MPRGGGQSGQATIEWAGLMLCVALIFGALLAGGREAAKGEAGRGLGEAVAKRITCAVRGKCAARGEGAGGALGGERGGRAGERGTRGAGEGGGRLARGVALGAPLGNPPGGRLSLVSPSPGGRSGLRRAVRVLSGAKRFLKRTWFVCLAYRNWQGDREHPRLLGEGLPPKETADRLNECVNPLSFLFG
jgi:hypothetical protein